MASKPPDLRRFVESKLTKLTPKVEQEAALVLARLFSRLAREAFARGEDVYGKPRPPGVAGNMLDLVATGLTSGSIGFEARGNRVRSTISNANYVRFLIGKYRILPNGRLPDAWVQEANRTIQRLFHARGVRL